MEMFYQLLCMVLEPQAYFTHKLGPERIKIQLIPLKKRLNETIKT